jgi:alcohol dehydrogenase class IV
VQSGQLVFAEMNRVVFGHPAADVVVEEADRLGAKRVFILSGGTLNRKTNEVAKIAKAFGGRFAGVHDDMPARQRRPPATRRRRPRQAQRPGFRNPPPPKSLGMPRTLKEVGVARDDLPRLAENCMLDDWTFSNPRIISSPDQIMDILEATMG